MTELDLTLKLAEPLPEKVPMTPLPPPWRYVPNLKADQDGNDAGHAFPYLIYAGSDFIAQVATDQMCEHSRDEEHARLIAAAPLLLAELQNLVRKIERDNLHTTAGIDTSKARDAISEALGS
jgi:hypothetical protein